MEDSSFDTNITNFMTAIGLLRRRIRAVVASNDLSWTQMLVISRLAKGGPVTAADLARAESMKPQSMGTIIGELKELGLVDRKPHPTDGRQMMIELTTEGIACRQSATDEKRTWLAHAVAQLSGEEQKTLFAAAEIVRRMVEM